MTDTGRGHKLRPADQDAQQRALSASIVNGLRAHQPGGVPLVDEQGCLEGPFNAFLLQPQLGQHLQALGAALRYQCRLADRAREIAILVVAAHQDAEFERYAHEPVAQALGVTPHQLSGIRAGDHRSLTPPDAQIAAATRELLQSGDLSDATSAQLASTIGEAQIFELTTLVGYYRLLALQLRVFRVSAPAPAQLAFWAPGGPCTGAPR